MRQRRYSHAGVLIAVLAGLSAWLVPASPASAAGTFTADRSTVDFGMQRVGTWGALERVTLTAASESVIVNGVFVDGGNAVLEFLGLDGDPDTTYCYSTDGSGDPVTLAAGESCVVDLTFLPNDEGTRTATLGFDTDAATNPSVNLRGTGTVGYYLAGTLGQVAGFGDADDLGDASDLPLTEPIVGMATTPSGDGFWLVASDGGVFSFGDAEFHGSMGGKPLNQPIVGMASTPSGEGYWLVASDGGIFTFGDAPFLGSMGGTPLNEPVVGMATDMWTGGYWMVASDGGIFSFDAPFRGSMGGTPLNQPIVGMDATPTGDGYHMIALDGGVFSFGDAEFRGSMGGKPLNEPMIGLAEYPTGHGYWTAALDGGIFTFGRNVPYLGSLGGQGIDDVIDIAGTAQPGLGTLLGIAAESDGGRVRVTPRHDLPESRRSVD